MLNENFKSEPNNIAENSNEKLLNVILDFIKNENEKNININQVLVSCPSCLSSDVVKNGNYKGRKRYRCNHCNKSFNDYTGTLFSHIQDMDKLNEYTKQLLLGKTPIQLSKELKISKNTSTAWKKKIMDSLIKVSAR